MNWEWRIHNKRATRTHLFYINPWDDLRVYAYCHTVYAAIANDEWVTNKQLPKCKTCIKGMTKLVKQELKR